MKQTLQLRASPSCNVQALMMIHRAGVHQFKQSKAHARVHPTKQSNAPANLMTTTAVQLCKLEALHLLWMEPLAAARLDSHSIAL